MYIFYSRKKNVLKSNRVTLNNEEGEYKDTRVSGVGIAINP